MSIVALFIAGFAGFLVLHLLESLMQAIFDGSGLKYKHSLSRRIDSLRYLFGGPKVIDQAYANAHERPFKIATPSNDHLMVTSSEHIHELLAAPPGKLSLHAIAKEILQPKYTMYGFEWQDQRGVEGTGFVRALRSLLTSHLPRLQPDLNRIIKDSLEDELRNTSEDGFAPANLFPMTKRIVTKVNCFMFFGERLSKNAEFNAAALEFPQNVFLTAEFLRISPKFLRPLVAMIATGRHRAARTLHRYLEPIVKERLANRFNSESRERSHDDVPVDCMQWLIDTSPRKEPWSPARMTGEILAIWFSSVHQLAMVTTYVVEDLCLHNEYAEPLTQEIREHTQGESMASFDLGKLTLLDSFIKESTRWNSIDAISCRRKALEPYVFQDGSRVEKNDWVCIPQRAMMHDERRYSNPDIFDGFRFSRANRTIQAGKTTGDVPDKVPSTMTDATAEWPIWGLGNTACPGRFYASLVLKLIMCQILTEWQCKMPDTTSPRHFFWRSSVVPRESTVVHFRKQPRQSLAVP